MFLARTGDTAAEDTGSLLRHHRLPTNWGHRLPTKTTGSLLRVDTGSLLTKILGTLLRTGSLRAQERQE